MSSSQVSPQPVDPVASASASRLPLGEYGIAVGLLGIGVVVLLDGMGQRASTSASGVGAGFMPTVVGISVIGLAIALGVQISRGHLGEAETAEGDVDVRHTKWVPLGVCVAAALIFVAAVDLLGYVIVSTIVFWLVAWALGARQHLRSALIALVLSLVVYLGFTRGLGISLPAGLLEGIL